jgi:hypothetical protein
MRLRHGIFPFWESIPHLSANLLASGLSGKSNREIRRGSQFLDRRLVPDQRCEKNLHTRSLHALKIGFANLQLGRDDSFVDGIGDRWSW